MEDAVTEAGAPPGISTEVSPPLDVSLLARWQRVLAARSQDLTLPDAASLLGASLDSVRQQVEGGRIDALQDDRGRIRISASVTYTPDGILTEDPADAATIARMWSELRSLRDQLDASRAEQARLLTELEAAESALQYTKGEVGNLWRVITTRNLKQAARKAAHDSHEAARIITLAEHRDRIRTKVADVREIARRRKWPWSLVG